MTTPDYTAHNFVDFTTPITAAILNDDEAATISLHNILGINPKDYGALGNGVHDDTTALQNALNATPVGAVCNLPYGQYAISAPLVVPPGITFRGGHSDTLNYTGALASPCNLKVLASFSGTAAVKLQGKFEGGYATHNVGTRVERITVDGTAAPAGIRGFETLGYVREATFDRCTVTKSTGDGFAVDVDASSTDPSKSAQSLRFLHCVADNVGGSGFQMSNVPDTTWIDCNAQGSGISGFIIAGSPNGQMIGCRAEWSAQQGCYLTSGFWGTAQGSGGFNMTACLTDRNGINGVFIDATGTAPINMNGCTHRRDGRNSTVSGFAAVSVATTATMPVAVNGIQVFPGVDDNGTGNLTPQIGVSAPTGAPVTMVASGYIHAATTASSGGTNLFVSHIVGTATGTTATPTRVNPSVP